MAVRDASPAGWWSYQHVLPGMQAEAAETFAELLELLPASTR
jgi:hypothetical protein